jgi:hypothetical protein
LIPEQEFLLRAVRSFVGSESTESASGLLPAVTDWRLVFRLAARHRVTPLVLRALSAPDWSELPAPCAAEIRVQALGLARTNLLLTAESLRLIDLFAQSSISVVPFKGPTLATLLYGDAGLREFCDLDFLVRREDVPRVKKALLENGYLTDLPVQPDRETAYLKARHELHFCAPDGTLIEIHQSFLAPYCSFQLNDEHLWSHLDSARYCGREVLALRPEDLLLVLCGHGTKHVWSKIAWICDVAMLLAKNRELDWSRIMTRAGELGAIRMLLLGVHLAHQLLGALAPCEVLRRAERDQSVSKLAQQVQIAIFADAHPGTFQSHLFFLEARERLRDKLRYCGHLAFMPTEEDYSLLPLPSSLSSLYYPLHTLRVASKYGLAAVRTAF